MVVLDVGFEVIHQAVDPLRQQRDLNFRRAGVSRVRFVLTDRFVFASFASATVAISPPRARTSSFLLNRKNLSHGRRNCKVRQRFDKGLRTNAIAG